MRVDELVGRVRGPAVLDVGCLGHEIKIGSPDWLHGRLRERFDDVSGLDLSKPGLDELAAAGFDQLHEGSAETFSLPRRFDTVVAGELIEHLGNPAGFLARAREHLAPGGRIVLSTPWTFSAHYASYALLKYPDSCQNRQHTMWFCPRTLEELASRVDLRITEVELVADYDLDSPSPVYRRGAKLLLSARRLLPGRLVDNTIIAVLEPVDARVES